MLFRCFGSGYSSLGLLKEFEVDALKLDRIFFLDIENKKAKDVIGCLLILQKNFMLLLLRKALKTFSRQTI